MLFVPFFFLYSNALCYPGSVDRKDTNTKRETMASSVENAILRFHKTPVRSVRSFALFSFLYSCALLYSFRSRSTQPYFGVSTTWMGCFGSFGHRRDGRRGDNRLKSDGGIWSGNFSKKKDRVSNVFGRFSSDLILFIMS